MNGSGDRLSPAARDTRKRSRPELSNEMVQALAAILSSSEDAVIAKTVDGTITIWNEGATRIYGRSAEQMVGRSYEVIVPPEHLEEERARHARVGAGTAESGFRCHRLRADGSSVDLVMSMSPVRDSTGAVTGVASISRPVSAAERDDARVALLLEAAPDAIVCVDTSGTIVSVNAQVITMFGYARDELLGEAIEVLVPESHRGRHLQQRSAFLREPKARAMGVGLSLTGRRRDGSAFPVEVSLAPDRSGPEALVIAAIRDVTEQRRTERQARENETRLRQLAESVDTVFILRQIDPPAYLYVSPGCRTVLGVDPEELMSSPDPVGLAVHPDDRERVERLYLRASRAGRPAQSEHRIVTPDGRVRWVRVLSTPVPNPHGPVERTVVTVEDIGDRIRAAEALRKAEAAARSANEAKNQFLSRMSHELRTPLNAVLGFGQLLQMQLAGSEHAEAVDQILKGGRHLLHLINDILDISRIEAGQTSISAEPVPVSGLLEEALQLMSPLAETGGVTLMAPVQHSDCHVLADRQRLLQVLLNLLSNAVKYNRYGGRVWVERLVHERQVSLTVADDGPGIALDLQQRLFVPFDRLGAERTGVDGTGIGLTLTRSLVQLMGGSLIVDSAAGQGSRFTVTLPRAELPEITVVGDRPMELPSTPPTAEAASGSYLLLYIEDNEPNVRVVEHLLTLRREWRLVHAATGSLGVELAEAHHPDLVLLDLHLPDGPGERVLRILKGKPATKELPVVILTADATTGQARRLMADGALRYLTKPLDVPDLLGLLDETVASKEAPVRV